VGHAEHIERIPAEVEIAVSRIYSPKPWGTIFGGQTAGGKYAKIKALGLVVPPAEGEVWRARGHWAKDDYGWQLEAEFAVRVKPSGKLLLRFLQERIRGIGPDRVERLRRSLGERQFGAPRDHPARRRRVPGPKLGLHGDHAGRTAGGACRHSGRIRRDPLATVPPCGSVRLLRSGASWRWGGKLVRRPYASWNRKDCVTRFHRTTRTIRTGVDFR